MSAVLAAAYEVVASIFLFGMVLAEQVAGTLPIDPAGLRPAAAQCALRAPVTVARSETPYLITHTPERQP